jgi:hypothetical protein
LVALAFLGPCPDGQEVRHLDGDPLNNRVDNLEYGSRTENILDVYRIGRPWRTLTAEQALSVRARLQAGETAAAIARDLGVGPAVIYGIKQGRTFKWLK